MDEFIPYTPPRVYLWLVKQADRVYVGDNKYSAFVAAAHTDTEARNMTPSDAFGWGYGVELDPSTLVVECIGMAANGVESGTIILSSYL